MDFIKSLRVFKSVADFRSFSKTSEKLEMPKSAVSDYVLSLEKNIGTKLFHRTTRRVSLTQDGIEFYDKAQIILNLCEDATNQFNSPKNQVSGRLRIDMPIGIAQKLLIPKIPLFLDANPNLKLELSATDRPTDVIQEGFDCVIRIGQPHSNNLGCRKIGEIPVINAAAKKYMEKFGNIRELSDLENHYLVDYDTQFGPHNAVFEYIDCSEVRQVRMNSLIRVNNTIAYQSACLAGLGIIQNPITGLKEYLLSGELIRILPNFEPPPLSISVITPQKYNIPKRTMVFIEWFESLMPEYI